MHDIIKASVFAAIGVLVFASLLVPVVSDAMTDNGDAIDYTNFGTSSGRDVFDKISTASIVYEISTAGVTVNGESLTWSVASNWPTLVYTDGGYITVKNDFSAVQFQKMNLETNAFDNTLMNVVEGSPVTVTISNNTVTAGANSFTFSKGYYWTATAASDKYFLALDLTVRPGTWYVNNMSDLIAYGMYTSGENDCYYELAGGKLTTNGDYTTAVNATLTKVDGTTDIYQLTNFTVSVGEESFTPYLCLIPATIHGHQTSGALYDMLGVLPIAVICVLIFGVLGAALYSRIE